MRLVIPQDSECLDGAARVSQTPGRSTRWNTCADGTGFAYPSMSALAVDSAVVAQAAYLAARIAAAADAADWANATL